MCVLENAVSIVHKYLELISGRFNYFSFFILIFRFEAQVLLWQVTHDVILQWLSSEYAVDSAIALKTLSGSNVCPLHGKEADFNARQG